MKIRWFVKKLTTLFFSLKLYIENDTTLNIQHFVNQNSESLLQY